MLKKHEELLGALKEAERQARELYAQGAALDGVITSLQGLQRQVFERVQAYGRVQAKPKPETRSKAAKPD